MNKEYKDKQLFETLKNLPPEISEAKVQSIIQTLPLLPIPKTHWISQISLNSIIMSSTVITLIVGTTLMLTHGNHAEKITSNGIPIERTIPTIAEEETNEKLVETAILETDKSEEITLEKQFAIMPLPEQEIPLLADNYYDLPELLSLSDVTQVQLMDTFESMTNAPSKESSWLSIDLNLERCKSIPNVSDKNIKLLKVSLLNKLKKDEIIASKKGKMMLTFNKNGILINNQPLENQLQKKYLDFLKNYNIEPCANRVVITTPDYIAIGNRTKEGLKGHIQGRASIDDIDFFESYGTKLFPQKEEREIGSFHSLVVNGSVKVHWSKQPSSVVKLKLSGIPDHKVLTELVSGVLAISVLEEGLYEDAEVVVEIGAKKLKYIDVGEEAELLEIK
ncbi:MAG: hypothetical protein AAGG68_22360 [Bacteroidota bacterium]